MKHLPIAPLPLLLIGALLSACGDDDDATTPDAASGNADAATTPDASAPPDAMPAPDAEVPDAIPPAEMTLKVLEGDSPLADVPVVFSNPDGSLIASAQTDANGEATQVVPSDAMISIVNAEAGEASTSYIAYTLAGVMPGDMIELDVTQIPIGGGDGPASELAGTVTVDWAGPFTGVNQYKATDGCRTATEAAPASDGDPPSTTAEIDTRCLLEGDTADIIAQAVVSSDLGDQTHAATFVRGASLSSTVALPEWSDTFDGPTITTENPPVGVLAVLGDGTFMLGERTFDLGDGGFLFGGAGDFSVFVPEGLVPDAVQSQTAAAFGVDFGVTGIAMLIESQAGIGTNKTYDLSAELLAAVSDAARDLSNAARPAFSWTLAGGDSGGDYGQIVMDWAEGADSHTWLITLPPDYDGTWRLPELPAALEAFAPTATSEHGDPELLFADGSWIANDWDALRATGGLPANAAPATADYTIEFSAPIFPGTMAAARPLDARTLRGMLPRVPKRRAGWPRSR